MEESKAPRNFTLDSYVRARDDMIATNDGAYTTWDKYQAMRYRNYTEDEVCRIIDCGDPLERIQLSQDFFHKNGFYKRLILFYATFLKYQGLLTYSSENSNISPDKLKKSYNNALSYLEVMRVVDFCEHCAEKVFIEGCYYGLIVKKDKKTFSYLDLPAKYAVSNMKNHKGNPVIEFNVQYFDSITEQSKRQQALNCFPKSVQKIYKAYRKGKISEWAVIPDDCAICFPFSDCRPAFLAVLPSILQYDKSVEVEQERQIDEIKKIVVQHMPHLTDGRLVFEPDEAREMHQGTVNMLKKTKNISVLTSYADVDAIVSKTSAENSQNNLDGMSQNIYRQVGVSDQIFSSTGSSTLESSLNNDLALVMVIATKFGYFISDLLTSIFGNSNLSFKYQILPISNYNASKYIEDSFKLASSGYSYLIPTLALGINQKDLIQVKELENNVLKLEEVLKPLQSAFTQSAGGQDSKAPTSAGGRPQKQQEEKQETTIKKETSLDGQG